MFLQIKVVQRISDDDFDKEFDSSDEIVVEKKKKSKRTKASTGPAPTTYTATKQFQANPNFFSDIFNVRNGEGFSLRFKGFIRFQIPISTLGAVSQFLSNGAANSGIAVSKSKTVEKSY